MSNSWDPYRIDRPEVKDRRKGSVPCSWATNRYVWELRIEYTEIG